MMILRIVVITVFFLMSIGVALAEELPLLDTPAGKAFKEKRYDNALEEFKKLAEQNPKDALILRYLAMTLDRLGRYDEAIKVYHQALALQPQNPALHFHLGTTYYKAGMSEKAVESFKKVIELAPDTIYGKMAKQYIEAITQQKIQLQPSAPPNLFGLYFQVGAQYDPNIPSAPDDTSLYGGEKEGYRIFEYLWSTVRLIRTPKWLGGIELSTYQSQYPDSAFDRFRFSLYSIGALLQHTTTLGRFPFIASLQYEYRSALLEGDSYSKSHVATASTQIGLIPETMTQVYYKYTNDDFRDEGFDPQFSSRDGDNHAVGLSQVIYFANRKGNIKAGYEYQKNLAKGMNFDMDGHKVNAGIGFPLIWEIQASLGADYSYEKYPDFQGTEIRETNRTGYTAGISRWIGRHILSRLDYAYTDEKSTYDILTYNRWTLGMSLAYVY
jgi:hypothetical protein